MCIWSKYIWLLFSWRRKFCTSIRLFLNASDFDDILEDYAYEFDYDIEDIQKAKKRIKCKNREFDYIEIMNCGRSAYVKTIFEDKTIDAEAFVDNLVKEFNENYK